MGVVIHACFKASKAFKASSDSDTHSNFLLPATLTCQVIFQQLCNTSKALNEPSVMVHKAEKGMHLHVSLGQCTFQDCFQIQIAGLHPFFGNPMCQVGDLLFEKTTF